MGCAASSSSSLHRRRRKRPPVSEVAVFVPSLRVPLPVDLARHLRGLVSRHALDTVSAARARVVSSASENVSSNVLELRRSLEEYLPLLLGFTKKEFRLEFLVEFKWRDVVVQKKETCIASAWYELLSVVHMMAMMALLEANLVIVHSDSVVVCESEVSEDCKKTAIDLLLMASGYLEFCVRHILVHMPLGVKKNLPGELQEGVLEAIATQALGQGTEMQLGLAVESQKATLSVKRRLACEQVSYFAQAHYCLSGCDINEHEKKILLFIKWKYLEAKAAAYYFHGQMLDKGSAPSDHISAAYCILAAEELLIDSKRACLCFCLAAPVTRVPPAWGAMKHLHQKIPELASKKCQTYGYLFEEDKVPQPLPDLPEFQLSLRPDDYELPDIDAMWDAETCQPQVQTLKAHLEDEVYENEMP
ncbi:hypothetical protein QJS04_geneDACA020891 [Acorus gramineus]|uniref:BRO1 domain-containing protein n=1 Tax=Acorus gramineus TaxID=55184 RepID=A0AAV9B5S2_ACOGR|nr:hypothetical protein QJS04_geneDACA020891 [Acorus gramineus]